MAGVAEKGLVSQEIEDSGEYTPTDPDSPSESKVDLTALMPERNFGQLPSMGFEYGAFVLLCLASLSSCLWKLCIPKFIAEIEKALQHALPFEEYGASQTFFY